MLANWLISQMNRFRKAGSVLFELNPVHFFHILFSAFNHRALLISLILFSSSCLEYWSEENRLRENKSVQRSTAFWVLSWVVGTHTIGKPVWLYSLTLPSISDQLEARLRPKNIFFTFFGVSSVSTYIRQIWPLRSQVRFSQYNFDFFLAMMACYNLNQTRN